MVLDELAQLYRRHQLQYAGEYRPNRDDVQQDERGQARPDERHNTRTNPDEALQQQTQRWSWSVRNAPTSASTPSARANAPQTKTRTVKVTPGQEKRESHPAAPASVRERTLSPRLFA